MIQQGSCDCTKTELDMESIPPTMTTMQGTQWNDYHPIAFSIVIMHPLNF